MPSIISHQLLKYQRRKIKHVNTFVLMENNEIQHDLIGAKKVLTSAKAHEYGIKFLKLHQSLAVFHDARFENFLNGRSQEEL